MKKERISWAVPVLASAAIFVVIYFAACILQLNELSFLGFSFNFLLGSGLGYLAWLVVD
jgi:hypothetical protein